MDLGKAIETVVTAGPGAGIGLAMGLSVLITLLLTGKVVMIQRFTDMKEQRDKAERRIEILELEKRTLDHENDELRESASQLRVIVGGALSTARRNAALTTNVMYKRVREEPDGE